MRVLIVADQPAAQMALANILPERSDVEHMKQGQAQTPKNAICFNPPAARSVLPATYKRTEMVLAGRTKAEIIEGNKAAFEKGELPPLEHGAMSYMMSKSAYLTDEDDHDLAHLMFYAPPLEGKAWGADLPKSPVMLIPQFKGAQPIDVFIVPWGGGRTDPLLR